MAIETKADWRTSLSTDAQDYIARLERQFGDLPTEVSQALGEASVTGIKEVRDLVHDKWPTNESQALEAVELGIPGLTHGGNAHFVSGLADAIGGDRKIQKERRPLLARLFGTHSDREVKRVKPILDEIAAFEPELRELSDEALREKTTKFKARIESGEPTSEVLPEAYATAREVARRVLNMRHFDVQLMGGIFLHEGKVTEMGTGEGKTLVATLPAYLNALSGEGVHVVTVNDYLAKRDVQWMGPVYHALGLKVGVLQSAGDGGDLKSYVFEPGYRNEDPRLANLREVPRKEAYEADITYGTNNEFGFDYLRDNIASSMAGVNQREPHFAIVDEVDNILIDEARTPMIISVPGQEPPVEACKKADEVVRQLTCAAIVSKGEKTYEIEQTHPGDYIVDEKNKTVVLTGTGLERVEELLGIPNLYADIEMVSRIHNALKAHALFHVDHHYMVELDPTAKMTQTLPGGERKTIEGFNKIVIVDEHTQRPSPGRQWSEGIHQAVEAKEDANQLQLGLQGVPIQGEDRTAASITVQNYFRRYTDGHTAQGTQKRLSGMTGTAATEAQELGQIYELDVVTVPTNKPMNRTLHDDLVFPKKWARDNAVLDEILACHEIGRPVLVGTTSIDKSEELSKRLTEMDIPHQVLNAKEHEREAAIVAQAGRVGAITIATDMAGRGTDIVLGGNPDSMAAAAVDEGNVSKKGIDKDELAEVLAEVTKKQEYGLLVTEDAKSYAAALIQAKRITSQERQQVLKTGGLHIVGMTRHDSRRIDNQLLGRAGRQGDPGSAVFFLSLEDDLIRIFGGDKLGKFASAMGLKDDEPIRSGLVSKAVEKAQAKVENQHSKVRETLLKYDDTNNEQRKVMYAERRRILEGEDLQGTFDYMITEVLERLINSFITSEPRPWEESANKSPPLTLEEAEAEMFREKTNLQPQEWDFEELTKSFEAQFQMPLGIERDELEKMTSDQVHDRLETMIMDAREANDEAMGPAAVRALERKVLLLAMDALYAEHMQAMDALKQGIGFRAYGQKDPVLEYKFEGFNVFETTQQLIGNDAVRMIFQAEAEQARPRIAQFIQLSPDDPPEDERSVKRPGV